jgi:N-acetylmuramoyl-L-alanine amidase
MQYLICLLCFLMPTLLDKSEVVYDEAKNREIICVITNAYHEARGEGTYGMKLVSTVAYNRAKQKGESLCKTIYKPNQFSWTRAKRLPKVPDSFIYSFWQTARDVVDGVQVVDDKHKQVFYFHAKRVKPYWRSAVQQIVVHNNHVFYGASNEIRSNPSRYRLNNRLG